MHVIGHTTDLNGLRLVLACDAAQEWPEPVTQLRRDEGPAVFGAEHAMVVGADVGHAKNSAVPSGLWQHRTRFPNVETLGYFQNVPPGQHEQVSALMLQ